MLITKVKLVNGGDNGLQLSIIRPELKNRNYSSDEGHTAPVHVDLKAAMKSLAIHFGLLSDYIKLNQVKKIDGYDAKLIDDFIVTGFSVKGDDDDKGVVITGMKKKSNGKMIIINTPFTRFVEAEGSEYIFMEHLQGRIAHVEMEVKEYLEGKVAPDPQQSLFPEDEIEESNNNGAVVVTMNPDEHDGDDHIQTVPADSKAKNTKPKKSATKKSATKKASSKSKS